MSRGGRDIGKWQVILHINILLADVKKLYDENVAAWVYLHQYHQIG